jgi:hypothetical protein
MKKFTTKFTLLLATMLIVCCVLVKAEKRYVFALGDFPVTDPGWGAGWVDYRLDDINRVLYIWPDGSTLAGVPAVGTGSQGQADYTAFTVGNAGWWGCGYYTSPATNPNATMDLTDVTSNWTLHFAIRTDCAADITVSLGGSTTDPTDPLNVTFSGAKYVLTKLTLPLSKRDKTTWTEFNIKLSDLATAYDNNNKALPALTYKGLLKAENYLTFAGGNDTGSFVAWDNVYLTDGVTAVQTVKADNLEISVVGNQLKVTNNTIPVEIYSLSGARVLSSKLNDINISSLSPGVYIAKAGSRVCKFNK